MKPLKLTHSEIVEKKHFNKMANDYDENYNYQDPFTKYKINKKTSEFISFIKHTFKNKKLKILEFGCGTGEYTKLVAEMLPASEIIGIDISEKILEIAKKKCRALRNVRFYTQSAYSTQFPKNTFDVVFGFYVLHHLNLKRVSKEIKKVLKRNGYLYFYEPNIINPLVYLIKSNKYLKKRVGDTPDEWAINPLTIANSFSLFTKSSIVTREFVWPLKPIPFNVLKKIDILTRPCKNIPVINLFGGSVQLIFKNNK